MMNKKNTSPAMLIPPGSGPTNGRKHPKDIIGLPHTNIIFTIFLSQLLETKTGMKVWGKVIMKDLVPSPTLVEIPNCNN